MGEKRRGDESVEVHRFDQTNGVVDFDPGVDDAADDERLTLLEKGAASNIVNTGFGGGL